MSNRILTPRVLLQRSACRFPSSYNKTIQTTMAKKKQASKSKQQASRPKQSVRPRRRQRRSRVSQAPPGFRLASINPVIRPAMARKSQREVGSEMIGSYPSTNTNYTMLANIYCNPQQLGPRIGKLSDLYEKWEVNSLRFELIYAGSTAVTMSHVLAFDTDIGDASPPANATGIANMMSWNHSMMTGFNDGKKHTLDVRIQQPSDGYYTSYDTEGDYRFSYAGQLYLYEVVCTTGGMVSIICHYDITFYEPQLSNPITSSPFLEQSIAGAIPSSTNALTQFASAYIQDAMCKGVRFSGGASPSLDFAPGLYSIATRYTPDNAASISGPYLAAAVLSATGVTLTPNYVNGTAANDSPGSAGYTLLVDPGKIANLWYKLGGSIGAESGTGLMSYALSLIKSF